MSHETDPIILLDQKLEEQQALQRLAAQRMTSVIQSLSTLNQNEGNITNVVINMIYSVEAAASDHADSVWAGALVDAEISPTDILRVWEIKDEISRKEKEDITRTDLG